MYKIIFENYTEFFTISSFNLLKHKPKSLRIFLFVAVAFI
jgi:hypothetical protein